MTISWLDKKAMKIDILTPAKRKAFSRATCAIAIHCEFEDVARLKPLFGFSRGYINSVQSRF